ncbi:hypothetical protein KCV05_g17382, partial [Aureobasidium melanogenum]|jgi:hypothetical protein
MSLSLYLREPSRSFRSRRRDPSPIPLAQLAESVSADSARLLRIGLTHDVPTALAAIILALLRDPALNFAAQSTSLTNISRLDLSRNQHAIAIANLLRAQDLRPARLRLFQTLPARPNVFCQDLSGIRPNCRKNSNT